MEHAVNEAMEAIELDLSAVTTLVHISDKVLQSLETRISSGLREMY